MEHFACKDCGFATYSQAVANNHLLCLQAIHTTIFDKCPFSTSILLEYCRTNHENPDMMQYLLAHRTMDRVNRMASLHLIPLLLVQKQKYQSLLLYYDACPEDCSSLIHVLILHNKPCLLKRFHEKGIKLEDNHLTDAILNGRWEMASYIWLQTNTKISIVCQALNQSFLEVKDCSHSFLDILFWRERLFPLRMSFLLPFFFLYTAIKEKKESIRASIEACNEINKIPEDVKKYILYLYI